MNLSDRLDNIISKYVPEHTRIKPSMTLDTDLDLCTIEVIDIKLAIEEELDVIIDPHAPHRWVRVQDIYSTFVEALRDD